MSLLLILGARGRGVLTCARRGEGNEDQQQAPRQLRNRFDRILRPAALLRIALGLFAVPELADIAAKLQQRVRTVRSVEPVGAPEVAPTRTPVLVEGALAAIAC